MQEKDSTVEMLDDAVGAATEIIEGCDLAGMSIVKPHGIDTPAGSDAALRRLDELQFEMHEGPYRASMCFDALRKHEVVLARNLATDERWPTWVRA